MDRVYAGSGNDEVVITTLCELSRGELLDGGSGYDTLTTSWTVSELSALGVAISGFEAINLVEQDFDAVECCDVDICGVHGSCSQNLGVVQCQCEDGYLGRLCQYDPADVLPDFVDVADPTAWSHDPVSGRYYRHATRMELETNGWLPGTFLVTTSGLDIQLASGASSVDVTLPTTLSTATKLILDLRAVDDSTPFVELDGSNRTVEIMSLKPTIGLSRQDKSRPGPTTKVRPTTTRRPLPGVAHMSSGIIILVSTVTPRSSRATSSTHGR